MTRINRTFVAVAIVTFMTLGARAADAWKPADGPLKTRWAKDVSPETPLPEYPRPQMVRKDWINLNGLWEYAIVPKDQGRPAEWQGKTLVPYPVESALSGVMKMVGGENRLWYRRTFERPTNSDGKRVLLHFGAVDWETSVRVNGKEVGTHRGGYDPFTFDVTDALKADGAQELVVSVWDPTNDGTQPRGKQVKRPGGIFYTPVTGIWQTVWLEVVPADYIRSLRITSTLDSVTVAIEGGGANGNAEVAVFDGDAQVATVTGGMTATIKLADAKVWTPENPHLYRLVVRVGGDSVESYFGLRTIEVKKDDKGVNRILLNGQPIFMTGPLDQGFWPDGIYTAPTDEALKYDIEITKKLGFNCTRKHVKVEPARWYYWCDKLGLLVWQDMPSGDKSVGPNKGEITRTAESAKIYETELKAMVDALRNHPSIVMWVVFNEGWGQFDTVRVANWTKQYDPTRLVNPASGWNDFPAGDVIDMHKYPAPGAPPLQPNRAAVLGEFGGLGLPVEGHMWSQRNWGYRGVPDGKALTRQYVKMLSQAWHMRESAGLNAAIYTQITDVETEANGLLSYDREVIKVDVDAVAQANRGQAPPPPEYRTVVPTAEKEAITWRYTTEKPAEDWFKAEFDASKWKEGPAGFGTEQTPGAVVRTEWKTPDVWIRREVVVPEGALKSPLLMLHHDEDAEVYINGVLAARARGFTTSYEEFDLSPEGRAALRPGGKNVIAVHCKQTQGGQYIDVGVVDVK